MNSIREKATASLEAHAAGDARSADRLLPLVYGKLRALAASYLKRERPDHSLQPTALVHEAYLRLVDDSRISYEGKTHFYAVAAVEMRRVLIDHARRRATRKRGGDRTRICLHEETALVPEPSVDLLDLDRALESLEREIARPAQVAVLRLFGGMTSAEIASSLGVSERTVKNDWRYARTWLRRELSRGERDGS